MLFRHAHALVGLAASKSFPFLPPRRLSLRTLHVTASRSAKSKVPPTRVYGQRPTTPSQSQIGDKVVVRKTSAFQKLRVALLLLVPWVPIFLIMENHVATVMPVVGPSMWPLFNGRHKSDEPNNNDVVLVNRLYPLANLERGMVVVFRSPHNPEKVAVKRIVALAGDAITPSSDKYPGGRREIAIPYNYMWVEGDSMEPKHNLDSNTYGPITQSLIVGKVAAVVWPLNRISRVTWKDWEGSDRVREKAIVISHPDEDLGGDARKLSGSGKEDQLAEVQALLEAAK